MTKKKTNEISKTSDKLDNKFKSKKEKKLKLIIKEIPIKILKEAIKIKWPGWNNLKNKYIIVLLFMVIFAVLFFFIGMGIESVFRAIKAF